MLDFSRRIDRRACPWWPLRGANTAVEQWGRCRTLSRLTSPARALFPPHTPYNCTTPHQTKGTTPISTYPCYKAVCAGNATCCHYGGADMCCWNGGGGVPGPVPWLCGGVSFGISVSLRVHPQIQPFSSFLFPPRGPSFPSLSASPCCLLLYSVLDCWL